MMDKWHCCWRDEVTPQIVCASRVVAIYHNGTDDFPYELVVDSSGAIGDDWVFYSESPHAVACDVAGNWLRDESERLIELAKAKAEESKGVE